MDCHARHPLAFRQIDQRNQVIAQRVHAAVAKKSQQVQSPPRTHRLLAGSHECRFAEERPILDRLGDTYQILLDHAAGPEVQVADFRISHLTLRQAHSASRCLEQGVRSSLPEPVPRRHPRKARRVSLPLFPISESIDYDQNDGSALPHVGLAARE